MMRLRRDVGQRAFETVADFDAHLAIVRHDDDQHAVVLALLSELPALEHAGRVFLDRSRRLIVGTVSTAI